MSTFITTPTYLSDAPQIVMDPVTGKWIIPQLVFNYGYFPKWADPDPLNEDSGYQHKVADYFHTKLTEKWLYSAPQYKSLLKYFKVTKHGNKVTVELLTDPDKAHETAHSEEYAKYIFMYIEKYFASEKFVYKVLREYVRVTGIKWYDLYYNSPTLKDLMKHKLKRKIEATMYELEEKKD